MSVMDRSRVYKLSQGTQMIQGAHGTLLVNVERGSWAKLSPEAGGYLSAVLGGVAASATSCLRGTVLCRGNSSPRWKPDANGPLDQHVGFGHVRRTSVGGWAQTWRIRRPQRAYFVVTENCNLRCSTCYRGFQGVEASPDEARRSAQWIAQLGPDEVVVTGGEPALRNDLFDLIGIVSAGAKRTVLSTNATIIDTATARRIAQLGCDVQVSVESPDPDVHDSVRGEGSHMATVRGVENLVAAGVRRLELVTTVGNLSGFKPDAMEDFSRKLGATYHVSLFQPVGRGSTKALPLEDAFTFAGALIDHLEACWRRARGPARSTLDRMMHPEPRARCGAGERVIAVSARGMVYPCHLLYNPEMAISLDHAEELMRERGEIRAWVLPDVDTMPGCRNCDVRYFCGGGCRAAALQVSSDISGQDPRCHGYRAFFRSMMWAWQDGRAVGENLRSAREMLRCQRELRQ